MIKITDKELLKAIWLNQLRLTAKGVVQHFVGCKIEVCRYDWHDFKFACACHVYERHQITNLISEQQLLRRIRKLIKQGVVRVAYRYPCLTFFIDIPEAKSSFERAREFWLSKGAPSCGHQGFKPVSEKNESEWQLECERILINEFGESYHG